LDNTTGTTPTGIVYKGSSPFISDFNYGNNGTVTTAGQNTFVGIGAGNLTMGSTATLANQSSYNTALGNGALYTNTTGYYNTANGVNALLSNTTGNYNTANGVSALYANTTGNYNTANGMQALLSNTSGYQNTANGMQAGLYIADGVTANQTSNNSVYEGYNAMAQASGDTNEIVIGASAIGNGSNTVTLGNTSIVKTILQGNVGIGTTSPNALQENLKATEQLRLSYDATHYTSFTVGSGGSLTLGGTTGKVTVNAFQLGTSTTSGYVMTADASGNGTWQAGGVGITPAASGQRFVCITTTGQLVSSATACVGT
jgi:hypothetical protein